MVAYFDEDDGVAQLALRIGGARGGASWPLDNQLGHNAASARTHVRRTVARNLHITRGSLIELIGQETSLEYARDRAGGGQHHPIAHVQTTTLRRRYAIRLAVAAQSPHSTLAVRP